MAKLYQDGLEPGVEMDRRVCDALVNLGIWDCKEDELFVVCLPHNDSSDMSYGAFAVRKAHKGKPQYPSMPVWRPSISLEDALFGLTELARQTNKIKSLSYKLEFAPNILPGILGEAKTIEIVLALLDGQKFIVKKNINQKALAICESILWAHDIIEERVDAR